MFATKSGSSKLRKALWHKNRNKSTETPPESSTTNNNNNNHTLRTQQSVGFDREVSIDESVPNPCESLSISIEESPNENSSECSSPSRVYRQHSYSGTSIPEDEPLENTTKSNRPSSRLSIKESLRSRIIPPFLSGRTRVKSANPVLGQMPSVSLTSPTEESVPKSPLTVNVDCTCGVESARMSSADSPTNQLLTTTYQPNSCHLHYSASERHQRSTSSSPKNLVHSGSLLVPLKGIVRTNSGNSSEMLSKRNSLGTRYSPNFYLPSSMSDHSTIFDFEDLSTLDPQRQESVFSLFMSAHKCYDVIPTSGKLIIFDTELQVSKAFFALVYNGVRAAPIFDSKQQKFVGMLTITDFIQILNKYYTKGQVSQGIQELEQHKICTWREVFVKDGNVRPFTCIDPRESLYRAVELLCEQKIHRLPVLESETGNILYILTHKRLIKFLYLYLADLPKPSFMDKTPKELGIGSFDNICTISKDTPLIEALKFFLEKRVSALPLLDQDGKVVDIYAKFDVINLCAEKSYNNLDVTVFEALSHRSDWFEGVKTCYVDDSLSDVIDIIVKAEVHRLIAVDRNQKVAGIISLSDILKHLVLEPPNLEENPAAAQPIGVIFKGGDSTNSIESKDQQ